MNDTLDPPFGSGPPAQAAPDEPDRRELSRNPWLIVGLALAVLFVVQGGASVVSLVGRHSDSITRQVDAAPELLVRVASGTVRVTADAAASDTNQIHVTAHRTWSFREPRLVTSRTGNTLDIHVSCGFTMIGWCAADLDVRVPEGTALRVKTDSGNVEANGVQRPVTLETDSGTVSARNLTGGATLQTDSGDVKVSGVEGDLALDTDSGSIDVASSAAGTVKAKTDSGSITLDLTTDPQRVSADTDSGGVEIRLPDTVGVAYLLKLSTDSGTQAGSVRTDPSSARSITATTDSGDVLVGYR